MFFQYFSDFGNKIENGIRLNKIIYLRSFQGGNHKRVVRISFGLQKLLPGIQWAKKSQWDIEGQSHFGSNDQKKMPTFEARR